MVIDFAVEDDPDGPRFVTDRLVASGDINDAEAAHANTDWAIGIDAFIVRATMRHSGAHLPHGARIGARILPEFHHPCDSTHFRLPQLRSRLAYRNSRSKQLLIEKL